jgi:homoserine kinase type II
MAIFTRLDPDDLAAIARLYGLGRVERVEGLEVGTVNTNYLVRAGGRELFLRVNEGKDEDEVRYEAELVAYLAARGVETPPILRTLHGEPFARRRDRFVTLFPLVEGVHRSGDALAAEDLAGVGAALARLHLAGQGFPLRRESRYSFRRIVERWRGIPAQSDGALARGLADVDAELAWLEARAAQRAALPGGVIHGDLFPDNVLLDPAGPGLRALLDFEQAADGTFAYDLAVTLCAWSWGDGAFRAPLVRALVEGYRSVRLLSDAEVALLWIEARAAAVRFTVTRVTDVELNPALGDDRRAAKSWRRFHARLEALRALGPDGFGSLLGSGAAD